MLEGIVDIDGSILEGGGQILRISAALSAILSIPIRIRNIRAGRSTPGLRPQHLTGLRLIRDLTNGILIGDEIGSTQIELLPKSIQGGEYCVDTKTAGSITLMLQAALPCLLFAPRPTRLVLKGGTDVDMAPPIDFFSRVFLPVAQKFGVECSHNLVKRGFYPKGGGEVHFKANPVHNLESLVFDKAQKLNSVNGISFVAGTIPIRVAKEMSDSAEKTLKSFCSGLPISIQSIKETDDKAFGNGVAIVLTGKTEEGLIVGGSALGKPNTPAACVGQSAADELIDSCRSHVALDQHLQDQVIILMALASGTSRFLVGPLTLHTQTAIHITTLLTKVQFQVIDLKTNPETYVIECHGLGLVNKNVQ